MYKGYTALKHRHRDLNIESEFASRFEHTKQKYNCIDHLYGLVDLSSQDASPQ